MSKKQSNPPPPDGVRPKAPPGPPKVKYMNDEGVLTASMDNVLASILGDIACEVGDPGQLGVGDSIDRGLILRRRLEEEGFHLIRKT